SSASVTGCRSRTARTRSFSAESSDSSNHRFTRRLSLGRSQSAGSDDNVRGPGRETRDATAVQARLEVPRRAHADPQLLAREAQHTSRLEDALVEDGPVLVAAAYEEPAVAGGGGQDESLETRLRVTLGRRGCASGAGGRHGVCDQRPAGADRA